MTGRTRILPCCGAPDDGRGHVAGCRYDRAPRASGARPFCAARRYTVEPEGEPGRDYRPVDADRFAARVVDALNREGVTPR